MNTINPKLLKEMFIAGGEIVSNNYELINELNVFPVPDGDTGSNMKITIDGALSAIQPNEYTDFFSLGKQFSRGLLMNARGNSGVIFSQIIKGFTSGFKEGQTVIGIDDLATAFENAKTVAYRSVTTPVEGTILTVIRVISEKINEKKDSLQTIEDFFKFVCAEGEIILAKTTDILPELKEIGVVDSGGFGLCRFFEGMNNCLNTSNGTVATTAVSTTEPKTAVKKNIFVTDDINDGFGYCCEFIIEIGSKVAFSQSDKEEFDLKKFKNALAKIGDSMVVVVDDTIVKVHVHSLRPSAILAIGAKYGEFIKVKIENMTIQFLERNPGTTLSDCGTSQLKNAKLSNDIKIVATVPSAKLAEMYANELKINQTINCEASGNPSIQEFLHKIIETKCKNVIIVVDDSNAILAAKEAMGLVNKDINVEIVPANNIASSYVACLAFNPLATFEDNHHHMMRSIKRTNVGKISRSSKNVKYSHIDIAKDDIIGIINKKIHFSDKDPITVAKKLIDTLAEPKTLPRRKPKSAYVIYGQEATVRDVRDIEKYINEAYGLKCVTIEGAQPIYSYYIGIR